MIKAGAIVEDKKILKVGSSSKHLADAHLSYCLAEFRGQYVTWLYNASLGGFYHGHYFNSKAEAEADFEQRLSDFHSAFGANGGVK